MGWRFGLAAGSTVSAGSVATTSDLVMASTPAVQVAASRDLPGRDDRAAGCCQKVSRILLASCASALRTTGEVNGSKRQSANCRHAITRANSSASRRSGLSSSGVLT